MAQHDDSERESSRILKQVESDSAAGGVFFSRMADAGKGDAQDDDWIELWGTRIGRTIGMVVAAALMAWIVLYALNLF